MRASLQNRYRLRRAAGELRVRRLLARAQTSALLRWRFGRPGADRLLIAPQELRPADPAFYRELTDGWMLLAEQAFEVDPAQVFATPIANAAANQELHGFGWLRHLRDEGSAGAQAVAVKLVEDWIHARRDRDPVASRPEVVARRVISWISNADFLLAGASTRTYDRITGSLADQVIDLGAVSCAAEPGYARLLALTAAVMADLAIEGREAELARSLATLENALAADIDSNGCHLSRNPELMVEIMLDLIPLRYAVLARHKPSPPGVEATIRKVLIMLRRLTLGDGSLARFNGVGCTGIQHLSTVLSYDLSTDGPAGLSLASGYGRMALGPIVLVADVGPPPPVALAGHAAAGALSFELSIGTTVVFANAGCPTMAELDRRAGRLTRDQNTLVLAGSSSAAFVDQDGTPRVCGPSRVEARVSEADGRLVLEAEHDGYLADHGLLHRRRIELGDQGMLVTGIDRLVSPSGGLRLRRDLPLAVYFHLAPGTEFELTGEPGEALIYPTASPPWRFSVQGAELSIEEGTHYASAGGATASVSLVLRAATYGESEIVWSLSRLADEPQSDQCPISENEV